MELEDYGDLKHKHTHIHRVPELHQKTLNTVLKDWCMGVFDEEKCKPLNVSNFDEILNSSNDEVKMSEVFSNLLNLENLGAVQQSGTEKLKIFIRGTKIHMEITGAERENKTYSGEIIFDKTNNLLYSDLQVLKKDLEIFLPNQQGGDSTPVLHLRINITSSGFDFNGQSMSFRSGQSQNVDNFKNELEKINLKQILEENKGLMDTIDTTSRNIDKEKISIPDNLTPKRNIENLEKVDKKILRELIILFIYFLIGICFGIYCIYFFFVVELK